MATHIQIGDISPRIQYAADGVQTAYTYPFPIFADADVEVYEGAALKTLTTDYAVTGAGNSSGGTVTFTAPPAAGMVVTLKRALAIRRTTDFQESGEFRAKVINDELDYQTAVLQQLNDDLGRSFRLADTDPAAALTLPDSATRASKYLGFDASGNPIATDAAGPMGPQGPAGNMDGSNNLSELTIPATARTNMGLVIGTDVLSPTGDGSALTGIATGATAAEKADIMLNSFRIAVNGGLSVLSMADGRTDVFNDELGIDPAASLNKAYDATNKDYYTFGGYTANVVPVMTSNTAPSGTVSASSVFTAGQEWLTFDGVTDGTTSYRSAGVTAAWLAYQFTTAKTITQYVIYPMSAASLTLAPTAWTFEGWTGTAWVVLDSQTGITTWADLTAKTFQFTNTTAYIQYRLNVTAANGGTYLQFSELEMMETVVPLNMTLQSVAMTALAQPDNVFAVLREEDVDVVTPNTDLIFEAGRDGGVTWTAVPLAEAATLSPGRILTGSVSIAAQPVGTVMKWRVRTLNNKALIIHAVGLEWR